MAPAGLRVKSVDIQLQQVGNVPAALRSASLSNMLGVLLTPLLVSQLLPGAGNGLSLQAMEDIALQNPATFHHWADAALLDWGLAVAVPVPDGSRWPWLSADRRLCSVERRGDGGPVAPHVG